jgi:CRISPR-associated protein Cas1
VIEVGQVLFVQTAGVALALDGDCVRARFPDATWRQLPLSRLDSVVVFGDVQLSTQLLCRCVEDGIAVAMLSPFGRPRAVVTGAGHANSAARHAQHLAPLTLHGDGCWPHRSSRERLTTSGGCWTR